MEKESGNEGEERVRIPAGTFAGKEGGSTASGEAASRPADGEDGDALHAEAMGAPAPHRQQQARVGQGDQGPRRAAGSPVRRKQHKDSEAQIEEWRARQATRAVQHPEYRQGPPKRRSDQPGKASAGPETRRQAHAATGAPGDRRVPTYPVAGQTAKRPGYGQDVSGRTMPGKAPAGRPAAAGGRPPRPQPKTSQTFPTSSSGKPAKGPAARRTPSQGGPAPDAGTARPQGKPVTPKPDDAQPSYLGAIGESEGAARAKRFFFEDAPRWAKRKGHQAMDAASAMDPGLRRKVAIIAAVILVYFIVMVHFSLHFYPGSTIGNVDVSGMTVSEAASALEESAGDYELQVEGGNGISFTVMSHEASLSLDSDALARQAMQGNPGIIWPIGVLFPHDHSDVILASADAGGFRSKVSDAVNWYNKEAEEPQNATVHYDEGEHAFKIVEEVRGNTLDEDKVVEHVAEALAVMQPVLTLGDDDYKKPEVRSDDGRLLEALEQAQTVLNTNVTFQAHNSDVATLNGETAAKWVLTDEDVKIALDEDQLNVWVQDLVDKSSTVGAKRTWTREDGVECTVEGGVYGWEADWLAVDEAVHDCVLNGKTETREVPMANEAAVYNGEHGRDWKSYIDVDLGAQHAVYYDDGGKVLWEADFVSGTPDGKHDTPEGVYVINNKESPSVLVGEANATGSPEYQTTVQYWMPWRGNDVGFHDATWQEAFGGTRYLEGYGSHGCINLSADDVAALYRLAPVGTVVVAHGAGSVKVEESPRQDDDGQSSSTSGSPESSDDDSDAYDEEGDPDSSNIDDGQSLEIDEAGMDW